MKPQNIIIAKPNSTVFGDQGSWVKEQLLEVLINRGMFSSALERYRQVVKEWCLFQFISVSGCLGLVCRGLICSSRHMGWYVNSTIRHWVKATLSM